MSNDQQTPPQVMPWLPAPAARVVPPPTAAPPNPWARMASNDFNPPPKRKRKRARLTGPTLLVSLVIGGFAAYRNMDFADKNSQPQEVVAPITIPLASAAPINVPFTVQTEAFGFVLPTTPEVKPITEFASDPTITGTQWTMPSDDTPLSVLALTYPVALDEAAQQTAIDTMASNIAVSIRGTVVSDTWATVDGVYQRDVVVSSTEGSVVFKCFGKGTWLVLVIGGSTGDAAPVGLAEIVASFRFV